MDQPVNQGKPRYRWAKRARDTIAPAVTAHGKLIELGGGYDFPGTLPDVVSEAIAAARSKRETLQYGPLYGLEDLRDAIVDYLRRDGISTARENILVVNGAKHGLDLVCRVFLEPGDLVIVAAPTYLNAVRIFKNAEAHFVSIPQDEEGMDTEILGNRLQARHDAGEPLPKLLFDMPDFHNPTAIAMSAARRQRLVELAKEYDFVIIEDDPYRRVRFGGASVPPIKAFDNDGRVISLGTISKILAPGLRIGWVNADPAIIRRMASHKSDGGTSPLLQRIVVQLFRSGKVDQHVAALSSLLRVHRDAMIDAIREHLPGTSVCAPNGGYFLWVQLPAEIDADELVRRAGNEGVSIISGRLCFAEEPAGSFLRLAYSFSAPDEIAEGVKRLGRAYVAMRSEVGAPTKEASDIDH
ncbi:PLP-dependent aminotransferase family protein [Bradyrhizobium zhanjiangense]|uniref:PLP-dependent aminotransferase family protein n=1 Tax=Bradyrhizobium zhanjiangense TaxID=1325107 RepID=A0ABY0DAA6_9BRAD|nr:PLP-dependent aminotransferase family protein [Bradyrhizobium zhanjiangense]RXG86638.1 PLP-dependent aminotransferase family protein [Bradyrhizobium zhanjiangense]